VTGLARATVPRAYSRSVLACRTRHRADGLDRRSRDLGPGSLLESHPRIYQATLDLTGCSAEDAVFVGDSLGTDALGPQRAGIRSLLLAPGASAQIHTEQVASLADAARLISGARPAGLA
jgi:phosphoglycolate phosphatase-like HAD superfamily hydrolase